MNMKINETFNGTARDIDAEPHLLLGNLIRENLHLTNTPIGWDSSHCAACTLLLNGRSVKFIGGLSFYRGFRFAVGLHS